MGGSRGIINTRVPGERHDDGNPGPSLIFLAMRTRWYFIIPFLITLAALAALVFWGASDDFAQRYRPEFYQ